MAQPKVISVTIIAGFRASVVIAWTSFILVAIIINNIQICL
jgi:hypothetical protein